MILSKNDNDFVTECGFLKNDNKRFYKNFKNILEDLNEDYLDYIKNKEESLIENVVNK